MSAFPIFGFSGKARHGKDTSATFLQNIAAARGVNLLIFPMALPMKARVYGACPEATIEEILVTKPPHIRNELQQEGTARGRDAYGDDFWVRHIAFFAHHFQATAPFIDGLIIPDVRFPNELDFVRTHGYATFVRSNRPTLTGEYAQHRSEISLDHLTPEVDFDVVLINDEGTTFDALAKQVEAKLSLVLPGHP